jgi:ribosomal protein S12 methylthiotransferase
MQHASDAVLARMRRPERKRTIRDRVARFRDAVPDVAIRTTCIVGFPGETDSDFEELLEFLEEIRFERVGAFAYSPQEGTRAADMIDDVPDAIKRERLERLTDLQRAITAERYESRVGKVARMIVDRTNESGETVGRLPWQADDVDGIAIVDELGGVGEFLDVAVEEVVDDYDFRVSLVGRVPAVPVRAAQRQTRSLPMAVTVGSYGR